MEPLLFLAFPVLFGIVFFFGIGVTIFQLFQAKGMMGEVAKAIKQAKAEGETPAEIQAIMEKTMSEHRKTEASNPTNIQLKKVMTRLGSLMMLAFLAFFFTMWMSATGPDWLQSSYGMIHKQVIYGLLSGTAVLVLIRGFVEDPGPNWAKLESTLLIVSFLSVFISCGAMVARLFITQPSV